MTLLERYDADERRNAVNAGMRREAVGPIVRYVDLVGRSSCVLYSALDETNVEAVIDEQVAYFDQLGHELEWKAFSHDRPADLVERLEDRGFVPDEQEAIVVLDLHAAPAEMFAAQPGVRRIRDPDELQTIRALKAEIEGGEDRTERLAWEMRQTPEELSVYVADVDGVAAACGWVRFPPNTAFASLWGGATLPALRGRGLYTALVRARASEARERGYSYVTVDAGHMSRPILERRGFVTLTLATACMRSRPE
jgi:GNAT superfamily N-acetyltransferase